MKELDINKAKRINYAVFTVVLVVSIVIIMLGLVYRYQHSFSSQRWISNPENRTKMVDNLLKEYTLTGKTKDQVIEILGNPTDGAYFKRHDNLVYYMGAERGLFGIDSEWLVLTLSEGDNVLSVDILVD